MVTLICISAYIKLLQLAPEFWPLYLLDTLLRLYAGYTIYSLLVYYNDNVRKFNASASNQELEVLDPDIEAKVVVPVKHLRPVQGVLKIFDGFCGFMSLRTCAFIFITLNLLSSIGLLVYFLCFEKFNEIQLVIYIVCFALNTVMIITLIAAIKMVNFCVLIFELFNNFLFSIFFLAKIDAFHSSSGFFSRRNFCLYLLANFIDARYRTRARNSRLEVPIHHT